MSLPPDTPQGIANTLGYLQHHLHELTERQNISENNINTTLVALTVQLQQLTQLVANLPSAHIKHPSSVCTIPSGVSTPRSDSKMYSSQALLPSGLQRRTSQQLCISELLLPVHLPGPGTVSRRRREDSLGSHVLQKWLCCQVVRKSVSSGSGDGDQREFDLETRVITNGNIIIPEMFHSCALNK